MELLKELCLACSPSGSEQRATDVLSKHMAQIDFTEECYHDKMGNKAWKIGNGPTKVLLSAHIDEVHARVSSIDDDGNCSLVSCGGIDPMALLSSEVIVMGDNGDIPGFVGKKPIHLDHDDKKNLKWRTLGYSSEPTLRMRPIKWA